VSEENSIYKIKMSIMEAFPEAEVVDVFLGPDVMDIKVIPRDITSEDEIVQIIVEGMNPWIVSE
jgi:hypothetical protein